MPTLSTWRWSAALAVGVLSVATLAIAAPPPRLEYQKIKTAEEYKAAVEQVLSKATLPAAIHSRVFPPTDVLGPVAEVAHIELLSADKPLLRAFAAAQFAAQDKPSESATTAMLARLVVEDNDATTEYLVTALGKADPKIAPALLAQLAEINKARHPHSQRVPAIIEILGHLRAADAVEPLMKLAPYFWAQPVIEALGRIGDARAIEPIAAHLKKRDSERRNAAVVALSRIGGDAAAQLVLDFLSAQEGHVDELVVVELAKWKEPRLLDFMRKVLKEHSAPAARAAAARWVGLMKLHTEIPGLIQALKDEYPEVCMGAAVSLYAMGQSGRALNEVSDMLTRRGGLPHKYDEAVAALVAMGPTVVPQLVATIRDPGIEYGIKSYYAEALGKLGESGEEAAVAMARDLVPQVRVNALEALRASGNANHLPIFQRAVEHDPTPSVRSAAVVRLQDFGWPGYRIMLALIAKPGPQAERTRVAAANGLHFLTTLPDAAVALEKALSDPSPLVRREAALSLVGFPRATTLPALEAAAARERDTDVIPALRRAVEQVRQRKQIP